MDGFKRLIFADMLANAIRQYRATGRMQIICVALLNRLGRSKATVVFVQNASLQCDGLLQVWSADSPGTLIAPNSQDGEIRLLLACEVSGKGESHTKREFVTNTRIRIAQQDCSCRSLGERLPGYRPYPVDKEGNRLGPEQIRNIDHWRHEIDPVARAVPELAFPALVGDNLRPGEIVGLLQRQLGNHPIRGTPWTRQQVLWLLQNSLYIGRRAYNRSESISLGRSKRRKRNSADQLIYSRRCEHGIQIIPDELFWAAQAKLKDFGHGRTRNQNVGRTPDKEHLFHASKLLRCALCGHPLRVAKVAEDRYLYSCKHLTDTRGLPNCQSHDAAALDDYIITELARKFEAVKGLGADFRRRAKISKSRDRFAALEARRDRERANLDAMCLNLLRLADKMDPDQLQASWELVARMTQQVNELDQQILTFGNDEMDSESQETLALITAVEAFETSDLSAKRALLTKIFSAVWIWPDEGVWIQWQTDEETDCESVTGRRLFEAKRWESLDFQRMEQDTRKLIEAGEIPQAAFHGACGETTVHHFYKGGTYERHTPRTLVRLFKIACVEYVDMRRLRADVEMWIDERLAEGWTWYRFEKECPVTRATIQKMYNREPLRRSSFIDMAIKVGGLDQYTVLPDSIHIPPHFDELAAWLVEAGEQIRYDSRGNDENTSVGT